MTDSAATTGAELLVDTLEEYGVVHVFGNPGTTELPVMHALEGSNLEYMLTLHEDIAVGMAAGYAHTYHYAGSTDSLPVGVAILHAIPGLAHGLSNLYNASCAGIPLVVFAGAHSTHFQHEEPLLSGDLLRLAAEFTKWSAEISHVDALPAMLRRAFRTALTPPQGPVFLSLPMNVMEAVTEATPEPLGQIPTAGRGDKGRIEQAAQAILAAGEPVLVVGDGISRSGPRSVETTVRFAEVAGVRVHGAILSGDVNFPTDHDQWASHVPPKADVARELYDVDTLIFAGCGSNTTLYSHELPLIPEDATCLHVGADPRELGKNTQADIAIIGDPGLVLDEIANRIETELPPETRKSRLERVRDANQTASELTTPSSTSPAPDRLSKEAVVRALNDVMPDAALVDEGVTSKYVLLANRTLSPGSFFTNAGGGLGYGLPAAVGAALAESNTADPRPVVAFVGDGSFLYYPQTLYTAASHDIDLTVVIPDNRGYSVLKDNLVEMYGGSRDDHDFIGMDIGPHADIVTSAKGNGVSAVQVRDENALLDALSDAVECSGPFVINALVHD